MREAIQAQLPRSKCLPLHPCQSPLLHVPAPGIRTPGMAEVQILPERISAITSMSIAAPARPCTRHTTARDGGSADIAGANIFHYIHVNRRSCTSLHPAYDRQGWRKCRYCRSEYLPLHPCQSPLLRVPAPGIRPPGMAEVQILPEQISAITSMSIAAPARPCARAYDRQGWRKCRYCRSEYLPLHPCQSPLLHVPAPAAYDRQGWRKCRYCRSKYLPLHPCQSPLLHVPAPGIRPPGMAEVQILQERISAITSM